MKKLLIGIILLTSFGVIYPQQNKEVFTIYLVRHAEKVIDKDNYKNPPLTEFGQLRATALADFLSLVDIEKVYSTDYIRTIETARPLAEAKGLEIEKYNPGELREFCIELLKNRESALVVGHSNTTPALAGLLTDQKLESIDESIYYLVYQVNIVGDNKTLSLFKSQFNCKQ